MDYIAPPGYHLQPVTGFAVAASSVPAKILADSKDVECVGVVVQSSAKDDSAASMSADMYVVVGGVKVWELVTGESSPLIPCSNTSEVSVATLSGDAFARGIVYRSAK